LVKNIFDKFYRVLYKSLTYNDSNAKEIWNINQKLASENNIIQLLVDKFDFKKHYINNYYYNDNNLKKERYENDGIIFYENKLLIIEIKAGALSSDAISENFESFENNFKEIFNKGVTQGERLINLLSIYDMNVYDEIII
jgi:hypothetical protein